VSHQCLALFFFNVDCTTNWISLTLLFWQLQF
jgi:hypothetical protein